MPLGLAAGSVASLSVSDAIGPLDAGAEGVYTASSTAASRRKRCSHRVRR